ncbi:MAG: hypothetical protein IT350_02440 [Deltaproteobacteria bacterium]|nr:hypothetical protein [Deltaproteobacteria bacterium]
MPMKSWGGLWAIAALAMLFAGCGDDDDDSSGDDDANDDDSVDDDSSDDDAGDDDTWPPLPDDDADDDADIPPSLASRPELLEWSAWFEDVDHANEPRPRMIGGFGIGNGRCFTMTAGKLPLTAWFNTLGPDYQKNLRFFSEKTLDLYRFGERLAWDRERAYRIRGTGVTVIRQDAGDISLWTIDFAPEGDDVDGTAATSALGRIVVAHNRGDAPADGLSVALGTVWGHVNEGLITETIHEDGKNLAYGFWNAEKGAGVSVELETLAPGGEAVTPVLMAFARSGTGDTDDAREVFADVAALDPWDVLAATVDRWKNYEAEGARVSASDERLTDLFEGMTVNLRNQQTFEGAITQMSEYSFAWLRDIMGPAVFLPLMGRAPQFRDMLDYYWLATLVNGNFANAMKVDHDISNPPAEPDWASMGTLTGKIGAESPSYHILHYRADLDATGDWSRIEERYGMLRHALIHQDFREGCLLPFSGDETFRPAMAVAYGDGLSGNYEDTHLSANSSFLFVAAAEFMVQVADHMGEAGHAAGYQALADAVRDCAEDYYWLDARGFYSPMIDKITLEPLDAPFEDVNATPLWIGFQHDDDVHGKDNLINAFEALDEKDGVFHSPVSPTWIALTRLAGVEEGAMTGMAQGYQLEALARIDHPWAADSFANYTNMYHPTGNTSEGIIVDDWGRFAYLYEPFGYLVDLTARYRSWEGPINAAAMLRYLFGLDLDARNERIAIAPHLPGGWDFARIDGATVGDAHFDLVVERADDGYRVTISPDSDLTVNAKLAIDGDAGVVTVNGVETAATTETEWGRFRARLTGLSADAGEDLVLEIQPE